MDSGDTRSVEKTRLEVDLKPLDAGTHTVLWRVTSVSDSHQSSGSFRFTVSGGGRLSLGTAGGATQALIDTRPTPANTSIRWGELVGLALIAGSIGSLIIVWHPLIPTVSNEARSSIWHRLRLLTFLGLVVVLITLIADLLSRASGGVSEDLGLAQLYDTSYRTASSGLCFYLASSYSYPLGYCGYGLSASTRGLVCGRYGWWRA